MWTQMAQVTSARLLLVLQVPEGLPVGVRSRPAHERYAGAPTGVAPCPARRAGAPRPWDYSLFDGFIPAQARPVPRQGKNNEPKSMPSQIRSKMSSNSGVSAVLPFLWIAG